MRQGRGTLAWLLLGLWAPLACGAGGSNGADGGHAVVLLYHHVAENTPPSTSVTPATFAAHLAHLADLGYRVLPLQDIVSSLENRTPLPPRAVAITFDDAYDSVYREAAPRLEEKGFPYTVFVSTDYVDQGSRPYLTWDELRALESRGASMANHSRDHSHYVFRPPDESESAWRRRIGEDIRAAQARLEDELERPLRMLAYPYGEFTPALEDLARELGFTAFGQQSGPVGPATATTSLPRFPMASRYADLDGLAEKLRTRPFQVTVLTDPGPVLKPAGGPPTLRLRLAAPGARLDALGCFVTGQERPEVTWVDREQGIVEVQARRTLPVGRSKYTCTAPAAAGGGAFHWYSHLFMKPPAAERWYPD